ncbi:hypothetical protein E1A91_D02G023900v1 [Gossypium mustelinum]|uniref:Uncharacterized protein n=1 Tax=Gossypium mustelinum TaxID=34275 RepID=A0A5D2VQY5_GOSMU|nr:hypothetical protein E1A91_D02G023900v1 [Gossypium mustelinum]
MGFLFSARVRNPAWEPRRHPPFFPRNATEDDGQRHAEQRASALYHRNRREENEKKKKEAVLVPRFNSSPTTVIRAPAKRPWRSGQKAGNWRATARRWRRPADVRRHRVCFSAEWGLFWARVSSFFGPGYFVF